jgi:hypothetical protein
VNLDTVAWSEAMKSFEPSICSQVLAGRQKTWLDEILVTRKELSELTGIPLITLINWGRLKGLQNINTIPYQKIGRGVFYRLGDVKEYLKKNNKG